MDDELDDALVYGYTGASTIGHEITHGFDDEGRQFDAKGNLQQLVDNSRWNIFQSTQRQRFGKSIQQHCSYRALHANGRASLGENLADLIRYWLDWMRS